MLALYIVAGIVLFILLVFSIPVDMAFDVGGPGAARARMRVGWLFGLLGKEIGRSRKKPKERASKRKKKKRSAKPFLSLLVTKGVVRGLLKLSRRILSGVRVRHLDARLRIGLNDPADTVMLYSALWPVLVPSPVTARPRCEWSSLSRERPWTLPHVGGSGWSHTNGVVRAPVRPVAGRSASDETDGDAALKIEEVRAGQPIRVGEITLVPIERTLVSCVGMEGGAVVRGSKDLAGIVVVSGKSRYVLDLTGEEVPMDQYLMQVPELARLLDRL